MTSTSLPLASCLTAVIDLRDGQAVHAIAGQRHRYRPVQLDDVIAGNAIELADRYRQLNINSLYIADLDAIQNRGDNFRLIRELASRCSETWVDAGTESLRFMSSPDPLPSSVRVIVPTECYRSTEHWIDAIKRLPQGTAALGLDLRGHIVKTAEEPSSAISTDDSRIDLQRWLEAAIGSHVGAVIALDLAYVGMSQGIGTIDACRWISQQWPELQLISGGGVRSATEVHALLQAGCQRVLVATALHDDQSELVRQLHVNKS